MENNNQLATIFEAAKIAGILGLLGGGVVSTYIPEYDGPWSAPENGNLKFLHFKFANGADGFNVGLLRALMIQCPITWPAMVAYEIHYQVPLSPLPLPLFPEPMKSPVPSPLTPGGEMPPLKQGQHMTPFGPVKEADKEASPA